MSSMPECRECGTYVHSGSCLCMQCAVTLERQLEALSWAQWISVEERLPEVDVIILVSWTSDRHIMRARYMGGVYPWLVIGRGYVNDVTHWMPLPSAPERE